MAAARAQTQPAVELVVRGNGDGAARCFDAAMLRQRIAHYGAERLAKADELRLELDVDAPESAELRIFRDRELVARRRFEQLPAACVDRRDAVALSIAMALEGVIQALEPDASRSAADPAARAETSRPDPTNPNAENDRAGSKRQSELASERAANAATRAQPMPLAAASESADSEPELEPTPHGSRSDPIHTQLHVGGRWLAHALPASVWTGTLGVELGFSRRVAVDISAFTSTIGDSTFAGARAETRLTGGEVLGCSALRFGEFAAQGCLGAIAAACRATGFDYAVQFPAATLLWAAGTARFALRWPEEHAVLLRLVMQGHVNVVRPELRVDGSTEQLQPAWLGASAGLDVIVALE